MKRKLNIAVILVLCLLILPACENNANQGSVNGENPSDAVNRIQTPGGTELDADAEGRSQADLLQPEYDYDANILSVRDLSTGDLTATYTFDTTQSPILTAKNNKGFFVLANQGEADIQNANEISIVKGDSSSDTIYCWQFDYNLKLLHSYTLTDPALLESLQGCPLSVSPDGKELIYAQVDCLYRYIFETKASEQIPLELEKTVYFEAIGFSGSGKYLAYYGSLADQEGTAYGCIELTSGKGKVSFADGFTGMSLLVNGEYAAIANVVLPASMGGPAETGSVLFIDMIKMQGKKIQVESGEESGRVSVSADGKYMITSRNTGADSGILRCYNASDGVKITEQPYTMEVNCKSYTIFVSGTSAYAGLSTDDGNAISPAIVLP